MLPLRSHPSSAAHYAAKRFSLLTNTWVNRARTSGKWLARINAWLSGGAWRTWSSGSTRAAGELPFAPNHRRRQVDDAGDFLLRAVERVGVIGELKGEFYQLWQLISLAAFVGPFVGASIPKLHLELGDVFRQDQGMLILIFVEFHD